MPSVSRRTFCHSVLATGAAWPVAGCGTLLYPERRGQRGGRIDPAVAILNGIGLLFFIIPGAVAFAVDFITGAIYLPGTASRDRPDGVRTVIFDGRLTPERLTDLLSAELPARPVDLNDATVRRWDEASRADIAAWTRQV